LGTLWNIVGFQTKLKYGAQSKVFKMIPGLESATFARLGGIHRNTFLNAPKLLDDRLRLKSMPRLRFAGQITGVEGYVESASMGLLAGRLAAADRMGTTMTVPPATTAHGALARHITEGHITGAKTFQPMNVNFGLFPDIETPTHNAEGKRIKGKEKGRHRKMAIAARALRDFEIWAEPVTTSVAAE
ncbi:MAG: FAD-dependent oxidoreductase, partial [Pseudomonadota bacterium]